MFDNLLKNWVNHKHYSSDIIGGTGLPDAPNDTNYYGRHALGWSSLGSIFQAILTNTVNIKSINGSSILGSGNMTISGGGAGSDTTAIHNNAANEIHALTDKSTPVDADEIIGEDSAATPTAFTKIKLSLSNLWTNYFKGKADALYVAKVTGKGLSTVDFHSKNQYLSHR